MSRPSLAIDQLPEAPTQSKTARAGNTTRRRDSNKADYCVAVSFVGDAVAILLGLSLGFWIKFRSGWITFGVESKDLTFFDYTKLIIVGTIFLLAAFKRLGLYDDRSLLRYRQIAKGVIYGTTFWFFAYLGVSLALKFEPPISRIYVAAS